MAAQFAINPELLDWARERAAMSRDQILKTINNFPKWESGEIQPSLPQLTKFANLVHVPIGYLFLSTPPEEPMPIADFRQGKSGSSTRFSVNLLDTIYLCQARQEWYRDYAKNEGFERLAFIGCVTLDTPVKEAAQKLHQIIGVVTKSKNSAGFLRNLSDQIETLGVLVMVNSLVGNSTRRKLVIEEFHGFSLVDDLAPIIFINGNDSKSEKIFTLMHEFAHLLLGKNYSGLSGEIVTPKKLHRVETWCNQVAAEYLLPEDAVRSNFKDNDLIESKMGVFRKKFFVSNFVILLRFRNLRLINQEQFSDYWKREVEGSKNVKLPMIESGGNFYKILSVRVSKRFERALVSDCIVGNTLYRDAMYMLGIKKSSMINEIARKKEIIK